MGNDCVKVVVPRAPVEHLADALGGSHEHGRVARPARAHAHGERLVGRGLHRVDHVQHREAAAIAAIQHLLRMTADRVAAEMADLLDGRATPAHPRRGRAGNSSEPLEGAG